MKTLLINYFLYFGLLMLFAGKGEYLQGVGAFWHSLNIAFNTEKNLHKK
jgi:hypothetical protein